MQQFTFGSLFTGVGGMDLGLERAGMVCKWQVELESYRRQILERHFPGLRRHDDARTFPPSDPSEWWCHLIAGGDPCQANSNACRAADPLAESLGGEFLRILDAVRPRLFLRENSGSVRKNAPWPWWRFREHAERLGYAVLPFKLRACCVGADHRRERMFLLGEIQDANQAGLQRDVCEEMAGEDFWRQDANPAGSDQWTAIPEVCGGAHGIPAGVDYRKRIEACGDAVVPQVAEWIGRRILAAASC